jgi:long-chain acyl-CoA synthetase
MTESEQLEIQRMDTWPKILEYNHRKYGSRHKAMRYKHYGIWQSYTWQDYFLNVKYLALGLLSLGFKPGDKLLIVGDNAPEWYFAELAAQSNLGVSVGLYSDLAAEEIKYIANNSEAAFAMVEDQEQVDKLAPILRQLPHLKKIVYWQYKGLSNQDSDTFLGFRTVLSLGREYEKSHPDIFEKNISAGKADDICAVVYTSGTTGNEPKGAVHSYKTLRWVAESYTRLDQWQPGDNLVSYLPPAWITEQWLAFGCHLLSAGTVNFAESAETQQQDIREIGPSIVLYSSRLWERQAGKVQARIQGTGVLKKLTYRLFMPVGYRVADHRDKQEKPGWFWRVLQIPANLLLFRPLRDSLGLPHARVCYTSGSRCVKRLFAFIMHWSSLEKSLWLNRGRRHYRRRRENRHLGAETINPGVEVAITLSGEISTGMLVISWGISRTLPLLPK